MTNELEKNFFGTFRIPQLCCKKYITNCTKYGECEECVNYDKDFSTYPQITDRILLELICIANQYEYYPTSTNIKNIQARTLRILLKAKKYLKDTYSHQGCPNSLVRKVRTLFEEGS